jgi:hypothetical protein
MAVGDQVLAEDPETGGRGSRDVSHLWVHEDTLIDLTLIDLTIGEAQLATTEDHPFWNHTDQQWQPADALDPGDQLLTPDGNPFTLNAINTTTASTTTAYNLTINDIHTYYVSVGHPAVLVHNTCPDLPDATEALPSGGWDLPMGRRWQVDRQPVVHRTCLGTDGASDA